MNAPFIPGEQYSRIFDQPRPVQLAGLQEQVKSLAAMSSEVMQTTDEVLDFALAEIAYTIHVIRERIFYDDSERYRMAAAATPRKSAATNPDTLEDIA